MERSSPRARRTRSCGTRACSRLIWASPWLAHTDGKETIMRMRRREFLKTTGGGATAAAVLRGRAWAQAKPIRIGYTLSATGPYSAGAGITQGTGYALWQEQVNAKGGLAVKGEGRRPVEYVTIDDRSEIETAVRFYEKLMGDDKVDLILPPWGTAMNFAVAPVANKYGYPMIGPTVSSNKLKELSFPYFYAILQQPDACMGAFTSFLKGLKGTGADVFLGLTYPPDNILAASQSKEVDFNPPVYLAAVGTAFPFYRDRFKGAEGVSGIAGWNPKMKYPGAREYYKAHVKKHQKEPDRWASAFAYGSLQILERCVGEVGLDRKKIKEMLDATEFQTVAGPIKFAKGVNVTTPGMVGQWQKGEFEIVWPKTLATAPVIIPKPAWA